MDSSQIHPRIPRKMAMSYTGQVLKKTNPQGHILPAFVQSGASIHPALLPAYMWSSTSVTAGSTKLDWDKKTRELLSYINSSQWYFRSISPWAGGSQARGIFILWISPAQEPKLEMLLWLLPFLGLHTSVFKVQPVKQNHQPHPGKCVRNANPEEHPHPNSQCFLNLNMECLEGQNAGKPLSEPLFPSFQPIQNAEFVSHSASDEIPY